MATNHINRKIILRKRPQGSPVDTDFEAVEVEVDPLGAHQVLVEVGTLSIDAFIRTVLDVGSFHPTTNVGAAIAALGVGTVVESASPDFQPGDHVFGPLGAQTYACIGASALRKLDVTSFGPTAYLGALGLTTGLTAYVGMVHVAGVAPGDTVVVSGAAGAVGSIAGQVARLSGAGRVIGIAGGPEKIAFLNNELGFAAGIDYKSENVDVRLRELAPNGVNVFFDNVGGETLDTLLLHIVEGARVVICGAISQYETMADVRGPRNYLKLAERHARMQGFTVNHFLPQLPDAEVTLAHWLSSGQLVMREHIELGIDAFPATLRMLFTGGHYGKLLLQVANA
jgi:NADPH-dependent curcumin reductase